MNKKFVRRAIAMMVTLQLSATLFVGCAPTSTTPEASNGSSTPASGQPTPDAGGPLTKYPQMLDIHFARNVDDDLMDNIIPKTPGESIDNNRWLTLYQDELGINVVYDWTAKTGDAYNQKVNVTLASGDLPDVMTVTAAQMKELADNDMIEDLTPYWDQYATDFLKEIYNMQGTAALDSAAVNGKLMGIGTAEVYGDGVYLWLRTDWLKALGLSDPKTMQDLLAISDAFTNQDPDKNGVNDTYGLALVKDVYSGSMGLEGFFAGYHAYPNMWVKDESGKLAWGSTLPQVKEALAVLADMYKSGQLDKEFGVKDGGKVAETIASGKVGMEFGQQWNSLYPLNQSYQNNKDASWVGYPLVSADDQPARSPQKFSATEFLVVRKGFSNPEAIIKMMNVYAKIYHDPATDSEIFNKYCRPEENDHVGVWKFSPVVVNRPLNNIYIFEQMQEYRKTGDISKLGSPAKGNLENIEAYFAGDDAQWGWNEIYGEQGVFLSGLQYREENRFQYDAFVGVSTPTMVEKKATLEQLEKEVFVKIIMGSSPLEAYDKFVADWNQLGGEAMTNEVNEWYASVQ